MENPNNIQTNTEQSNSADIIAMVLEVIFGFFGNLGLGWLYAGNIPVAILAFIGFIIIAIVELFILSATLGIAACLIIPFNLVVAIISGLKARDYVRNSGANGSVLNVVIGVVVGIAVLCGAVTLLFGGLAALGSSFN